MKVTAGGEQDVGWVQSGRLTRLCAKWMRIRVLVIAVRLLARSKRMKRGGKGAGEVVAAD